MEGLEELEKFVGQPVSQAKEEKDVLYLTFNKKVLFITKKVTLAIKAEEAIQAVSIKAVEGATLVKAEYKGIRLYMDFAKEGEVAYKLSFKTNQITKA
jgi:hypothetical protein